MTRLLDAGGQSLTPVNFLTAHASSPFAYSSEEDRHAGRARTKREKAKVEILKFNRAAFEAKHREYSEGEDRAVEVHTEVCRPLQEELDALEAESLDHLTAGTAAPAQNDDRRAALRSMIFDADAVMSDALNRSKGLKAPLEKQIAELIRQIAEAATLDNKLTRAPLVNPVWAVEHHGCSTAVGPLSELASDARRQVSGWEAVVEKYQGEQQLALLRQIERGKAVADAFSLAAGVVRERADELYEQMMNE